MKSERHRFLGSQGHLLSALVDLPAAGEPAAFALFAHCFTCGKNLKGPHNISRALAARGIAVVRFDFTGIGASQGDFSDTNFSSNVEDLLAAATFMGQQFAAPSILIGHSLGGAAAINAARTLDSCRAVVTIAAPSSPDDLLRALGDVEQKVAEHGEAEVKIGGRRFRLKQQFVEDLQKSQMDEAIANLGKALLICHAPGDRTVSVEHAARIFTLARHPKSFVSLDGADHLLSEARDSQWLGGLIASWAARYVPELQRQNDS